MAIAYSSAIFQGTEIQKKQVQIYLLLKNPEKNTEDGVHLALAKLGNSG
jgi:hypothetical protein